MMIPRRRRTIRKGIVLGSIAILLLVLGLIMNARPPQSVSGFFMRVAHPIWEIGASVVGQASVFDVVRSKRALSLENEALRNELRDARLLLADRTTLLEENRELKAFRASASTTPGMTVAVLARPAITPYDTLLINAGAQDGIEEGTTVFVGDHIVLGTVADVFATTARVRLFSSPGVTTDIFLSESDVAGTAEGMGGGVFTLRIPSAASVAPENPVRLSGGTLRILGFIDSVDVSSGDLFQTVWFRTPVNINTIEWVMVSE